MCLIVFPLNHILKFVPFFSIPLEHIIANDELVRAAHVGYKHLTQRYAQLVVQLQLRIVNPACVHGHTEIGILEAPKTPFFNLQTDFLS